MDFGKQICWVLLEEMSFVILFPYRPMLTKTKKQIDKNPKIWNFTILLTTLVETISRGMHDFFGLHLSVLSEEMSFDIFTPM